MISRFIEASHGDGGNYGKFIVLRFDKRESQIKTRLPGHTGHPLFTFAGARKLNPKTTFVFDLQTGEGAAFYIGDKGGARIALSQRDIWVCPLYLPFLNWLWGQDMSDITKLPRYVDLSGAEFA